MLKPNAYGSPVTEANQPPPIALSEAQMLALLAASYPLPPAGPFGEVCFRGNGERGDVIPSGFCLIAQ